MDARSRRPAPLSPLLAAVALLAACSSSSSVDPTVTVTIGPAGGVVSLPGGPSLEVPPGALASQVTITIAPASAPDPEGSPSFDLAPPGTTFAVQATLRFPRPAGLAAGAAASLYLLQPGSLTAYDAYAATVGADGVTAKVNHLGQGFVGAACAEAGPCSAFLTTCQAGRLACTSGAPVCSAAGPAPNGAACGAGQVCLDDACVAATATRTVTLTFSRTHWPDSGVRTTVAEAAPGGRTVLGALVPDVGASGGSRLLPAVASGDAWQIEGVPVGSYFLLVNDPASSDTLYQFATSHPAFDRLSATRPDLDYASGATPVAIDVTGMVPWGALSSNLLLAGSQTETEGWPLASGPTPSVGDLTFPLRFDWSDPLALTHGTGLPDPAKGDVLYVYERLGELVGSGSATATHVTVRASARLTSFPAVVSGQLTQLVAPLTPVAQRTAPVNVKTSQFDALAASLGPGVRPYPDRGFGWTIFSTPHTSLGPDSTGFVGRNGYLMLPPGAPDFDYGLVGYGDQFDQGWAQYRQLSHPYTASILAPGASAPTEFSLFYFAHEPLSPPPPSPIVPALGPVATLTVAGLDATADVVTPVGSSPLVAWSAPALGTATSYALLLFQLGADASGVTYVRQVLAAQGLTGTSFRIPAGYLTRGAAYVAQVTANHEPWNGPDRNPFAAGTPSHYTPRLTGRFAPDGLPSGFPQPAGTVAVGFSVDDRANQVWKDGELRWKGSLSYDATTRLATLDATWAGPFPLLHDDGPWDRFPPGHEPSGAVAGDHVLGATIFVARQAAGQSFEYGLDDAAGYWLWSGSNGSFIVGPGSSAPIQAQGVTFAPHGAVDLKVEVELGRLLARTPPYVAPPVEFQGSLTGYLPASLVDDGTRGDAVAGDGVYTLQLSAAPFEAAPPYLGLLRAGDQPAFSILLGGERYQDPAGAAALQGVAVATKALGDPGWTGLAVQVQPAGARDAYVVVP